MFSSKSRSSCDNSRDIKLTYRYLQAQGLMHIPTYVLFIVSPLNLVFNYLLVRQDQGTCLSLLIEQIWGPASIRVGFVGGAIATALSYTLTVRPTLDLFIPY